MGLNVILDVSVEVFCIMLVHKMKSAKQHIVLRIKILGLLAILCGGLGTLAVAQTPNFSNPASPSLPALPQLPALGSPETTAAAPAAPSAAVPSATPATDVVKNVPVNPFPAAAPAAPEASEIPGLAPLAMPNPITTLPDVNVSNNGAPGGLVLPPIGNGPLPVAPVPAANIQPVLPSVTVDTVQKAGPKSWETRLAPTSFAYRGNYNYKRQILPAPLAQHTYDRNNQHLPTALTREDYTNLLFNSLARNDVTTARAILNAGNYLNATNAEGETPLAFARRIGAGDAAALLAARGAQL